MALDDFLPSATRFRKLTPILAALALLVVATPFAPARADPQADSRFVSDCVNANLRQGAAAAEQRCVGLIARACMNGAAQGADERQAACLSREASAWKVAMDAAWSKLEPRVAAYDADAQPGAHAALLSAQSAWERFAGAECGYAHALWGDGSFRGVAEADCRLNLTARRAIQLRAQFGAD